MSNPRTNGDQDWFSDHYNTGGDEMDEQPIESTIAEAIYDILIESCGAQEHWRGDFVYQQSIGCREYRFQGGFGFGGKFYNCSGKWYAGCYREDETDAIMGHIQRANLRLEILQLAGQMALIQPNNSTH